MDILFALLFILTGIIQILWALRQNHKNNKPSKSNTNDRITEFYQNDKSDQQQQENQNLNKGKKDTKYPFYSDF
jgi:predicted negative regulator of RcsB-dependent stress response